MAEDLEQILGNAFGKYLWDHLDEYSDEYWDENGDDSWEVNIPYDAFGGRLISENIDEIMGKFKKTLSEDPKLDYLYIIFSKI